jgi:hypothetical protein
LALLSIDVDRLPAIMDADPGCTSAAWSLFRTLESIAAPCSLNACGEA